jgi:hypothetical protein
MASAPKVVFGRDLPLPPDAQPFGMTFDAAARTSNQPGAGDTVSVSQNPPGAMAVYGITGDSSDPAGFSAQIYVTRNGQQRQLASVSFPGGNLAGTAQRPMFLGAAEILDPTDLVTVEVANLATAGADIQVVLWGAMVPQT